MSIRTRFNILGENSQEDQCPEQTSVGNMTDASVQNKESGPKFPPVCIHGVKSYKNILITIQKYVDIKKITNKTTNKDMVNIDVATTNDLCKLSKGFRAEMVKFHTYELKSKWAYKIVLSGLYHTTEVDDIKKKTW